MGCSPLSAHRQLLLYILYVETLTEQLLNILKKVRVQLPTRYNYTRVLSLKTTKVMLPYFLSYFYCLQQLTSMEQFSAKHLTQSPHLQRT